MKTSTLLIVFLILSAVFYSYADKTTKKKKTTLKTTEKTQSITKTTTPGEDIEISTPLTDEDTPTGGAEEDCTSGSDGPNPGSLGKYFIYVNCTTCKIKSELVVKGKGSEGKTTYTDDDDESAENSDENSEEEDKEKTTKKTTTEVEEEEDEEKTTKKTTTEAEEKTTKKTTTEAEEEEDEEKTTKKTTTEKEEKTTKKTKTEKEEKTTTEEEEKTTKKTTTEAEEEEDEEKTTKKTTTEAEEEKDEEKTTKEIVTTTDKSTKKTQTKSKRKPRKTKRFNDYHGVQPKECKEDNRNCQPELLDNATICQDGNKIVNCSEMHNYEHELTKELEQDWRRKIINTLKNEGRPDYNKRPRNTVTDDFDSGAEYRKNSNLHQKTDESIDENNKELIRRKKEIEGRKRNFETCVKGCEELKNKKIRFGRSDLCHYYCDYIDMFGCRNSSGYFFKLCNCSETLCIGEDQRNSSRQNEPADVYKNVENKQRKSKNPQTKIKTASEMESENDKNKNASIRCDQGKYSGECRRYECVDYCSNIGKYVNGQSRFKKGKQENRDQNTNPNSLKTKFKRSHPGLFTIDIDLNDHFERRMTRRLPGEDKENMHDLN